MSKLFPKYEINLEEGTVYSIRLKKTITSQSSYGWYHTCHIKDIYGNEYNYCHEVIIAEGLQLPKHLWPVEENGRRYIVDHIIPTRNGGTDKFSNLHLIPKPDNSRNPMSRMNNSLANTGKTYSQEYKDKMSRVMTNNPKKSKIVYQYTLNNELIAIYPSTNEVKRQNQGYLQSSVAEACRHDYYGSDIYKGYRWSYKPL